METRTKRHVHGLTTSGFAYNEEWTFRNRPCERHRPLVSYPWTYRWQDAKQPNGLGLPMTSEEITAFKQAKIVRVR